MGFGLSLVARLCPLWVDVPSAEAPAFAGMTAVDTVLRGIGVLGFVGCGLVPSP